MTVSPPHSQPGTAGYDRYRQRISDQVRSEPKPGPVHRTESDLQRATETAIRLAGFTDTASCPLEAVEKPRNPRLALSVGNP